MAHALRRVSISTARPSDSQFAFVSHNPGSSDAQLYCHLFKARHTRAAQFLNMLLCRCFQLAYLEQYPEEAHDESVEHKPAHTPSLLNQGFPLSVSALVSFRRAPFLGLFPGAKTPSKPNMEQQPSSPDEGLPTSPTLVRKEAIRPKTLRSGAYRSFTYTPHKQRHLLERLNTPKGKEQASPPVQRVRAPRLAETEEALAQAVWCWTGISNQCSTLLISEDVLGSYLLCPHPKKPNRGTLIIRFPSGLATYFLKTTPKGKFFLKRCHIEFDSIAALLEYYTEDKGELEYHLSCTRVNHGYEWEENFGMSRTAVPQHGHRKSSSRPVKRDCWI
ncbi:SH2 domain-containing protein 5 isoform X2 [Denticeps clupeoides]|nr:SH2 domain-containing protein 5 isoform X2 [Denticeps clupeoides]XP_028854545.1 SH2 domain-containing protein 5 isoform X2 [Denticeps clupeoides]